MATQRKVSTKVAPKVKASAESIRVVQLFNPKIDIRREEFKGVAGYNVQLE